MADALAVFAATIRSRRARVVRLLLEHSGDGLTDDVALVLASPRDNVT
jgi:hypothetical protein